MQTSLFVSHSSFPCLHLQPVFFWLLLLKKIRDFTVFTIEEVGLPQAHECEQILSLETEIKELIPHSAMDSGSTKFSLFSDIPKV